MKLDDIALDAAADTMDVQYPGSQREEAAEAIRAYLSALTPAQLRDNSVPSPADDDREIVFDYRNHRGQKARRRVAGPLTVWHGTTKWHPLPQWFLGGHCLDHDAHRDFALADCRFTPETPLTHLRESPSVPPGVAIIVLPDGAIFYVGPLKQAPNENVIPHGSVVNPNTDDFARVQQRMKELSPIATIQH